MTFRFNPQFDYTLCERKETNRGRHYVSKQGIKAPSVTTILGATKDKKELDAWRARVGTDKADQIVKESTDLGSLMHTHLEAHVKGEPRPKGTNMIRVMGEKMADVIINQGLSKLDEVWGVEVPLQYENLWAGTTDLVGVYDGEPCVMDFKTTNKPKTLERIFDYRLQLNAYRLAHDHVYNTRITKLVIFMVSRDLQYQQWEFKLDSFLDDEQSWLNRVAQYYELDIE